MNETNHNVHAEAFSLAQQGKSAASKMTSLCTDEKNHILSAMSKAILNGAELILEANKKDLVYARELGLSQALTERLTMTAEKIESMAQGIVYLISLPDPIGEKIEQIISPDGLIINKIRVPLGLLMMIYESRPNVTADAAALAVKSGNAIILKGGKEALHTNSAIADLLIVASEVSGLPKGTIQLIKSSDRALTNALMTDTTHVDAIIPRGGPKLKKAILNVAKVPVLMTGSGVCHLYIDKNADFEMAKSIALNAKTQRPGVCNAIETLLIHKDFPNPTELLLALIDKGVHLRVCAATWKLLLSNYPDLVNSRPTPGYSLAEEWDYSEEYLDLTLTVKRVDTLDEATQHIGMYSTGHSEAIVSTDPIEAARFMNQVPAACVYHNASTRFTDGGCFGFGCEIGIATQKLHARGPMGLREITSYQYQIHGTGQIRK